MKNHSSRLHKKGGQDLMHGGHQPSKEGLRSRTGDEATSPGSSKLEVHRKQATNAPGQGAPWSPYKAGRVSGGIWSHRGDQQSGPWVCWESAPPLAQFGGGYLIDRDQGSML